MIMRLFAFELEFRINGERMTRTFVAKDENNAIQSLYRSYPVDDGSVYVIAKKPA